jgi:hypothetical protein
MRPDQTDGALKASTVSGGGGDSHRLESPPLKETLIPKKAKDNKICVSPAVLAAASKDEQDLLQSLRTSPEGLTQSEAEERARECTGTSVTLWT